MKGILEWLAKGDPLDKIEDGIERFLNRVVAPFLVLLGVALIVVQIMLAIGG